MKLSSFLFFLPVIVALNSSKNATETDSGKKNSTEKISQDKKPTFEKFSEFEKPNDDPKRNSKSKAQVSDVMDGIRSNIDAESFLMTSFGIGLMVNNRTGRVGKTRLRNRFTSWKVERRGNHFVLKSPFGYLGRKHSIYDPDSQKGVDTSKRRLDSNECRDILKSKGEAQDDSVGLIDQAMRDIVIGNAQTPTEWSVFVHLPDRRLLLTNNKDVVTFDRRFLSMSSDIKDARLLTLMNVADLNDEEEDSADLVAEEDFGLGSSAL
jgi:hypothetical protein